MIRDDAKIIVTQTGVSLKEALTKDVLYVAFMGGVIGYLIGKYWKIYI